MDHSCGQQSVNDLSCLLCGRGLALFLTAASPKFLMQNCSCSAFLLLLYLIHLVLFYVLYEGLTKLPFGEKNAVADACMHCRGDLFGSLLRQEVAFFDKEEVGVLTSRLGSDCQAVVRALSTNINVALRNALQAIGNPYATCMLVLLMYAWTHAFWQ